MELNANGNTKKNVNLSANTYERVMQQYSEKSGTEYEPLENAPVDRLPFLLKKFLQTAKMINGQVYSSGTITTNFNGLCNILAKREKDPVNVKADPRFKTVMEMVKLKTGLSAAEGKGPGTQAKRPLTREHLSIALEEGTVGRSGPRPLVTSVYLAAVMGWGCRAGNECHAIRNEDLLYGPEIEGGVYAYIELSERITKTRTGNPGDERELEPKVFPDDEFPETCYVRTIMEYNRRKTPNQKKPDAPFFLNVLPAAVKDPERHEYWYVGTGERNSGIMGIHMLEALLGQALHKAGIDAKAEKISAISLRKGMLQSGTDCNVPDVHLSRFAGHKSLVSKKDYIRSAGAHHQTTGRVIHRNLYHGVNRGYGEEIRKIQQIKPVRLNREPPGLRRVTGNTTTPAMERQMVPAMERHMVPAMERQISSTMKRSRCVCFLK